MQARNVHAPQVGFNNNVRHKGKVFHIQTEDSGVNYARITTHLFADGGRILRSERTDYSELLGSKELAAELRRRMKEQHRAMFVALREGHLDHLIDPEGCPPPTAQSAPAQAASAAPKPQVSSRPRVTNVDIGSQPARPEIERPSVTRVARSGEHPPISVSGGAARPSLEGVEPSPVGGSIFGGGANISEQSLDDVILSYISDDLDGE